MKSSLPFKFKKFEIFHKQSSMKVGIDGTLLGAWCSIPQGGKVMDVGTGCGLIALMIAQRSQDSTILGIDIHHPSIVEASENFSNSPFAQRLKAENINFMDIINEREFDLIVSNPPFFNAGIKNVSNPRLAARHQYSLPLEKLISKSSDLLKENGLLSLIIPFEFRYTANLHALHSGLILNRYTTVQGNPKVKPKRILIEWKKISNDNHNDCLKLKDSSKKEQRDSLEENILILEKEPGCPTSQYIELCADFYLKF